MLESKGSLIAGSIFLIIFIIYTLSTLRIILIHTGFKSIHTVLLIYGIIRIGTQICSIGFSTQGFMHGQWIIAYSILHDESLFVLVLLLLHLIANAQDDIVGKSWLRPKKCDVKPNIINSKGKGFISGLVARFPPSFFLTHLFLIPGNVLLIHGYTTFSGLSILDIETKGNIKLSQAFRLTGNLIFLLQSIYNFEFAIYSRYKEKINHIYLTNIFYMTPFLICRGLMGLLSAIIPQLNYFNIINYTNSGLAGGNEKLLSLSNIVIYEYILSTIMELIVAVIILMSYKYKKEVKKQQEEEEEESISIISSTSEQHHIELDIVSVDSDKTAFSGNHSTLSK